MATLFGNARATIFCDRIPARLQITPLARTRRSSTWFLIRETFYWAKPAPVKESHLIFGDCFKRIHLLYEYQICYSWQSLHSHGSTLVVVEWQLPGRTTNFQVKRQIPSRTRPLLSWVLCFVYSVSRMDQNRPKSTPTVAVALFPANHVARNRLPGVGGQFLWDRSTNDSQICLQMSHPTQLQPQQSVQACIYSLTDRRLTTYAKCYATTSQSTLIQFEWR
jgi:hypothetical protein